MAANYEDLVPVVDRCAERGVRLVHFSTCEVYGRISLGLDNRARETMHEAESALVLGPIHLQRWTYACAKQLLERRIWALGEERDLDFTLVRPFNVIGPRMDFIPGIDGEGVPRVLARFMHALLLGRPLELVGGGTQRRSFIAVADFCDAVLRIIERPEVCRRQIVNVGNPDNDVSIAELARALAAAFAERVPEAPPAAYRHVQASDIYGEDYDDTPARVPDMGRAARLLDWRPYVTLRDALPGIVDAYVRRYGHSDA
jgi:UDP-apiose/xylose synthase